jgi:hypothetical protein
MKSSDSKSGTRARSNSNTMLYQSMDVDIVLNLLKETKSIQDEADILHYIYETK